MMCPLYFDLDIITYWMTMDLFCRLERNPICKKLKSYSSNLQISYYQQLNCRYNNVLMNIKIGLDHTHYLLFFCTYQTLNMTTLQLEMTSLFTCLELIDKIVDKMHIFIHIKQTKMILWHKYYSIYNVIYNCMTNQLKK